ncbi:hypothetical protein EKO27_g10652 [Xylaria grammica]|uniref:Uncharacterized protein n=1 Tax=Xylaria grammica TaxID=363999 RepID=A0A439CQL7_9PEZI|nr:hypothetical protein EKO27_g10652 [Xylaria grammica]
MDRGALFSYKWKGKYYVDIKYCSNAGPSGWGGCLISGIPSSPEEYKVWLQKMRSYYSTIAEHYEQLFTIPMDKFTETPSLDYLAVRLRTSIQSDLTPTKVPGGSIDWIYVIDLDRELFGIHNACFYHLSKIPPRFEQLMEEAQNYWLGLVGRNDVHESIAASDVRQPTPLAHDPTPAYMEMKPITIYPKQKSMLNCMPAFVVCERIYRFFVALYGECMCQAQDFGVESDFRFRELVFALMCLTSCSPEWVRLISTSNMLIKSRMDYVDLGGEVKGAWSWAAVIDSATREPKEFMTGFLSGYHLEDTQAGSAPKATSYWFSGALVYLRRDITSRERFYDAIVSAVARGKADGQTNFSAIILSLEHFVLLKFTDGNVQHTKRLDLSEFERAKVMSFYNNSKGEKTGYVDDEMHQHTPGHARRPLPRGTTDDRSDDSDWVHDGDLEPFEVLAHFFDATQKQGLKPFGVHNEGVFPDEVYHRIIGYADQETNIACRKVSRLFRDFASETFVMDNGLKFFYLPGKEVECFHNTPGQYSEKRAHPAQRMPWIPALGACDGSASMEPRILMERPSLLRENWFKSE